MAGNLGQRDRRAAGELLHSGAELAQVAGPDRGAGAGEQLEEPALAGSAMTAAR
jgi:hypothetical protein